MRQVIHIESLENPKVRFIKGLGRRSERKKTGLFLAEGIRLAESVVESGWEIQDCFFTSDVVEGERGRRLVENLSDKTRLYQVSTPVYKKISNTVSQQGIMLVVRRRKGVFSESIPSMKPLSGQHNSFFVILDGVQDPGNMGTIIRTADAAGVDAIFVTKGATDPFGDKAVRSAMGSLFHLPIFTDIGTEELVAFFQESEIPLFSTALHEESSNLYATRFPSSLAVAFGNEGKGISPLLLEQSTKLFIPMCKRESRGAESLNVSASAAVALYEIMRQRHYSDMHI